MVLSYYDGALPILILYINVRDVTPVVLRRAIMWWLVSIQSRCEAWTSRGSGYGYGSWSHLPAALDSAPAPRATSKLRKSLFLTKLASDWDFKSNTYIFLFWKEPNQSKKQLLHNRYRIYLDIISRGKLSSIYVANIDITYWSVRSSSMKREDSVWI